MTQPFMGEIQLWGGSWAPRSWAFCQGQLLAVSQFDGLFSLLGTTYGGDGRTTFGLPDLRGRVPIGQGSGTGLTPRVIGAKGGAETVTLTANELGSHTHGPFRASSDVGTGPSGGSNTLGRPTAPDLYINEDVAVAMASQSISMAGDGGAHDNVQPFLVLNYIIALYGVYPSKH